MGFFDTPEYEQRAATTVPAIAPDRRAALNDLKAARKAQAAHAAGITEEDDEFARLNAATISAEKKVPFGIFRAR